MSTLLLMPTMLRISTVLRMPTLLLMSTVCCVCLLSCICLLCCVCLICYLCLFPNTIPLSLTLHLSLSRMRTDKLFSFIYISFFPLARTCYRVVIYVSFRSLRRVTVAKVVWRFGSNLQVPGLKSREQPFFLSSIYTI